MTTKWIVALTSPRDIAPHPNFRDDSWRDLDTAEQVAGVIRNDWRVNSRLAFSGRISQNELSPIASALYLALQQDTATAGSTRLLEILEDLQEGTPEACATAVLYAITVAENDGYVEASNALQTQLDAIQGDSPEARLWRVTLQLQLGLRLTDAAIKHESLAPRALNSLQTITARDLPSYETLGGVGRPAVRIFEDILFALTSAALSQVSADDDVSVGDITDRAWVIGQRRGLAPPIARIYSTQADKYSNLTNLLVSGQIGSQQSNSLQDMDLFHESLQLELLGHSATRHMRAELAYFRLALVLETGQTGLADDCIRLLRHSTAVNQLEAVLRWVRQNGPLDVIASDARRVLFGRRSPCQLRTVELSVLSAGIDLLSVDECAFALGRLIDDDGTIHLPPELPHHLSVDAMRLGPAIRVIARAAKMSGQSDLAARALLRQMLSSREQADLLDQQLALAVQDLAWRDVNPQTVERWSDMHRSDRDRWAATRDQWNSISTLDVVSTRSNLPEESGELSAVANRLNLVILGNASIEDAFRGGIASDISLVRARLQLHASEAQRGVHTMYSQNAFDIAAGLLVQADAYELWPDALAFLANPLIWRNDKAAGLERLARAPEPLLPREVHGAGLAAWSVLRTNSDEPFQNTAVTDPFPAGLRFAIAYALIDGDEAASLVSSMIGSRNVRERREGAQTLSTLISRSDAPWARALVLVASYDRDAVVRSWAAVALVCGRDLLAREVGRLSTLLVEDGVDVPMAVLANIGHSDQPANGQAAEVLRSLAQQHPSRTVREAAAKFVSA